MAVGSTAGPCGMDKYVAGVRDEDINKKKKKKKNGKEHDDNATPDIIFYLKKN